MPSYLAADQAGLCPFTGSYASVAVWQKFLKPLLSSPQLEVNFFRGSKSIKPNPAGYYENPSFDRYQVGNDRCGWWTGAGETHLRKSRSPRQSQTIPTLYCLIFVFECGLKSHVTSTSSQRSLMVVVASKFCSKPLFGDPWEGRSNARSHIPHGAGVKKIQNGEGTRVHSLSPIGSSVNFCFGPSLQVTRWVGMHIITLSLGYDFHPRSRCGQIVYTPDFVPPPHHFPNLQRPAGH